MPIELKEGEACVKCCSRTCTCRERTERGWVPCGCDFCKSNQEEIQGKATYPTSKT